MRKPVERAAREEHERRDVEAGHRHREGEPARRRGAHREQRRQHQDEDERRLAPGILRPQVAAVAGLRHHRREHHRQRRERDRDPELAAELRLDARGKAVRRRILRRTQRRQRRGDDRACRARGHEQVAPRLDERRKLEVRPAPHRNRRKDIHRREHQHDAAHAAKERHLARTLAAAAAAQERRGGDRHDDSRESEDEHRGGRHRRPLQRQGLVDRVRAHRAVGAHELADLQHLVGERDRGEVDEHVPEHADVLHRDDKRERHDREQKHLVVGEAEAEDEGRRPEDLVGRPAHPAVGQQEHPHQEERIERVDLDDRRLRPLDRRKREGQRAGDAAAEAEPRAWPLLAVDEVTPRAADQHRRAAGGEGAEDGRAERDAPRRRRMAHVGDEGERLAEEPGAEGPERIPRRMRHAEVGGGGGELARVLQPDGWPEGIEIHRESGDRGRPERSPVQL